MAPRFGSVNTNYAQIALDLHMGCRHYSRMEAKTRLNLEVAPELYADLQRIAGEERTTMSNVFRVAFALYKVCHEAKKDGQHVGVVSDASRLDREFVGLI